MNKDYLYTKFKSAQRGAVMVLFALLLPVLFGFMGLGIDVGLAYVEKGKVQDIADAAALAGAAKLSANGSNDMNAIKVAVKSGRLNQHLQEIEETARTRIEQMVSHMAQTEGLTEELKATDPMKWVGLMNNIKASAEEQILRELIYA